MKTFARAVLFAAALLAGQASLLSSHAQAALGEDQATVDDDRAALSGNIKDANVSESGYTVYTIIASTHTVREYVTSDGKIFGIAWQGINHPNLEPLLGRYFSELKGAVKGRERGQARRSHGEVQGANLTLERSGTMRNFRGRAFIRALIPDGVSDHVIH